MRPRALVPPCPRAPHPPAVVRLAPSALRLGISALVGIPCSYLVLTLFLPSSYLVLTLFLPSSYLVLT